MVDENEAVLTGKDRKQRNSLFRSIRDGTFEDLEEFSPASASLLAFQFVSSFLTFSYRTKER